MGSETMGLKGVINAIRRVEAAEPLWLTHVPKQDTKHETKLTHSCDDEESFFDSSLRSESVPKSKGPRSF